MSDQQPTHATYRGQTVALPGSHSPEVEGTPGTVLVGRRSGMTAAAAVAGLAAAVSGVHQWAEAWAFATRRRPTLRPRRSRQVRGRRARCAVRVERRNTNRP